MPKGLSNRRRQTVASMLSDVDAIYCASNATHSLGNQEMEGNHGTCLLVDRASNSTCQPRVTITVGTMDMPNKAVCWCWLKREFISEIKSSSNGRDMQQRKYSLGVSERKLLLCI